MKFYQPEKDGRLPEELMSFMAFPTREMCRKWMEDNLEDPLAWEIHEYDNTDIEDAVLLDADGAFLYGNDVDGACSLSSYNTGKQLDAAQGKLLDTVRKALAKTGGKRIDFKDAVLLYEDDNDLLGNGSTDRVYVTAIDTEHIYAENHIQGYPIGNVVDLDDIDILRDTIREAVQ